MSTSFGPIYAEHYDLFYRHKNYQAECDFLEQSLRRFAGRQVRSILDLGCGTGGHALILARRGYQVTGVDRSPAMVAKARRKADQEDWAGIPPRFAVGDLRTVRLGAQFDAAIMMFAVLGYQVTDADLAAALATVRSHLAPSGVFVADFWYGPAVLAQRPSNRRYEWAEGDARLFRIADATLDGARRIIEVRYTLRRLQGDAVAAEAEEAHAIRFLYPEELAGLARQAGLELVHLCPVLELDGVLDESMWNASAVMRALPA
jgi:SAM-dependent methyltransferase